jgi:uncharacterized membrane protein
VRAILVVTSLILIEWAYVAFSGDYLDRGEKGPAWGFLLGLWITLIVSLAVLVFVFLVRMVWSQWRRSHPV